MPLMTWLSLMLPTYSQCRKAIKHFAGVWVLFCCGFGGFLINFYSFSRVIYGVLELPLEDQGFSSHKVQYFSMPVFIFIGFAVLFVVYIYLNNIETNGGIVWWNHQTRLFHFIVAPQKS